MSEATDPTPAPWSDVTSLSLLWEAAIGATPPIGSRLRGGLPDRWVRFHYLPDGERLAASPAQRAEVLHRFRAVLSALSADAEEQWLVTTCGWGTQKPAPRPLDLSTLMPATYWRDVAPAEPADQTASVYATAVPADTAAPALADLLLVWVADARTADVILAPPSCAWLFHPYDGGMDVIARDPAERAALANQFADWLSARPDQL